jgi:flavin reductase (DIM6/NTAB) family NADH-FMN oxidoreductase RutF
MTEMKACAPENRCLDGADMHEVIWPTILYFETPIALVTTLNTDGTPNIGPMSSVWRSDTQP